EQMLESYEERLGLLKRHERIQRGLDRLEAQIARLPEEWRGELAETVRMLRGADLGADADGDAGSGSNGDAGPGAAAWKPDASSGAGGGAGRGGRRRGGPGCPSEEAVAAAANNAGRSRAWAKKPGRADGIPEGGGEDGV